MYIALGQITLKPDASKTQFMLHAMLSLIQAKLARGNILATTHGDGVLVHWSLTAWTDRDAAMAYRASGAHRRAMRASRELAADITFRHWEADAVPEIEELVRSPSPTTE